MSRLGFIQRQALKADLALFTRLARYDNKILDETLPRLTRAADNSRLWMALAALMFASRRRELRRAAMRGLMSLAGTSAIVNGPLKWAGRRTRPSLDLVPEARRLLKIPVTTSFPSGHTASAFAFASGAAVESRVAGTLLFPMAMAVGVSRVYTGAHYPADVLAGAVVGVAAAATSGRIWPIPPDGPAKGTVVEMPAERLPTETGKGLTVVINQASGVSGGPIASRLSSLLPDATQIEVDPEKGEDLESALERAATTSKALGICGGDGSVNTAARAAHENDIPLLVFPGGTLDHFAHALGIGSLRLAKAALNGGQVRSVDIGWIDGLPFLNTASIGSYVEMVQGRQALEHRLGKWPALMVALYRVLRTSEPIGVEIDGEQKRLWLAFFGNCHYRPAGFGPRWRERLDDGLIDLRYVEAGAPWARTRLFAAVVTGRLGRCKVYVQRPVSSVKISAPQETPLSRDGETFSGSSSFEVGKTLRGLKVLVPAN